MLHGEEADKHLKKPCITSNIKGKGKLALLFELFYSEEEIQV